MNFFNIFSGKQKSKEVAKNRLKVVLVQDKGGLSEELLAKLQVEIMEVINKYIEIDDATMDVGVATDPDSLLAAVPVGDYLDDDEVTEIDGKGITAVSTAADLGYSAPRAGEVIGVTPSAELTAGSFCLIAKYIVFGRGHTTES